VSVRLANRLLATVAAVVLCGGGLLIVAEIVSSAMGSGRLVIPYTGWYHEARHNSFASDSARWLFIGLAAGGLVLVVLQVWHQRPATRALNASDDSLKLVVRRHSIERALQRAAQHVDGISHARVRLQRRRVDVRARTGRRDPRDLHERVEQALAQRLESLGLASTPSVRVRVRHRDHP
jgi:hypothetical protein